ncbi:MAG: hypothetical protein KIT14_11160 [bacterium]|nr:hypothetical protein [bacterium]
MTEDRTGSDVVALSRWRALVARSRQPRKRLEALLGDASAAAIVPQLGVEELYYLVRSVGPEDALDLLRLATPEQIRGCLDFDVWDRDRVRPARALAWLHVLDELDPVRLAAAVRGLDDELVALTIARYAVVHDRTLDEAPDPHLRHPVWPSPDGTFLVELVTSHAEAARTLERVLERLYKGDPDLARRVLQDAKWGVDAEMEEDAFRWRSGRMADLGFVDYHQALEVYRWIDPSRVRVEGAPPAAEAVESGEPEALPLPLGEPLGEDSFLGRVLAGIDDPKLLGPLAQMLVALVNRVLAADRVDPADVETVRAVAARARDTLSLGLEYLAGGELGRARGVLASAPLLLIFRVGHALTAALQRRAQPLHREGMGFDEPDLDALVETRPLFPGGLDDPPMAGPRPFRSLTDVRRVEAWLDELERRPAGA